MSAPFWLDDHVGLVNESTDASLFIKGITFLVWDNGLTVGPWLEHGNVVLLRPVADWNDWMPLALTMLDSVLKSGQKVFVAGDCLYLGCCYLMRYCQNTLDQALAQLRFAFPDVAEPVPQRDLLEAFEKALPGRSLVFEKKMPLPQHIPPVTGGTLPKVAPPVRANLAPAPGRSGHQMPPAVSAPLIGPSGVNRPSLQGSPTVGPQQPVGMALPVPASGGELLVPPPAPRNPMLDEEQADGTAKAGDSVRLIVAQEAIQAADVIPEAKVN